jgi:predicted XRE-type DNA-binding protein
MTEHEHTTSVEIWRPVAGFPAYRVSNFGRIQSCWRKGAFGRSELSDDWSDLNPDITHGGKGYYRVQLRKDGKTTKRHVHVLILEAFVGPCPSGMECRHIDGDSLNNRLDNLCWGSRSENEQDKVRHGRFHGGFERGEGHKMAKLTEEQVAEIRRLYAAGEMQAQIAARFGISRPSISSIINGKHWAHTHDERLKEEGRKKRLGLLDEQVAEIRRLYADGVFQRDIAARFGIAQSMVSRIVNGLTRKQPGDT